MTATHERLPRPASLGNAATAIFALLGLIDVALTAVIGSPDASPLLVSLGVAALGLITLLSLVPARRGSRGALTAVVVTRVISAVLAGPAFFLNAPGLGHRGRGMTALAPRGDRPQEDPGAGLPPRLADTWS